MARRIPHQRAALALNKQLAGESLTRQERLALDNLQSRLGLAKPLSQYAPRTRRRYLAAARDGLTAREANRRDWSKRPGAITGARRTARIEELRSAIWDSTLSRASHTPEEIDDLKDLYGDAFVLRLLTDQHSSLAAYTDGDAGPGNRRWRNRGDIIRQYRQVDDIDSTDFDAYFYYHGTLG